MILFFHFSFSFSTMSDIWKLIKEGKEKLNIKKKEGDEMEDVRLLILCLL